MSPTLVLTAIKQEIYRASQLNGSRRPSRLWCFLVLLSMESKKKIALVGKGVKESGKFGKMTPNLDSENCDPQLIVASKKFDDIQYLVRAEYPVLRMYVFMNVNGKWRGVPVSKFNMILYSGFSEEYNEIARIVKDVNEKGGEDR